MKISQLAGCVVLYNPDKNVIANIQSYLPFVSRLWVIDNSEHADPTLLKNLQSFENLVYFNNNGNQGIANALNKAAEFAKNDHYDWLLTMDQDSQFLNNNSITVLINALDKMSTADPKLAIISAKHVVTEIKEEIRPESAIKSIDGCMTSGNFISLAIWESIGKFKDSLFIDYVDHEYCLRLKKKGYTMYEATNSFLKHNLGNFEVINSSPFKSYTVTHHNFIRRYYITRNRLFCISRYLFSDSKYCLTEFYNLWAEYGKILLYEKDKLKKSRSFMLGIFHFCVGRYGKY